MTDELQPPKSSTPGYGDIKVSRATLDLVELVQSVVDTQLATLEAMVKLGAPAPELSRLTAKIGTTNKLIRALVENVRSDLERGSDAQ